MRTYPLCVGGEAIDVAVSSSHCPAPFVLLPLWHHRLSDLLHLAYPDTAPNKPQLMSCKYMKTEKNVIFLAIRTDHLSRQARDKNTQA